MTDPRAALADMTNGIDGWIHWPPELIERGLAERGVLLVTEDKLRRELQRAGIGSADWYAPRIFAALSAEVTE